MKSGAPQAEAKLLAAAVTRALQNAHRLACAQVTPDLTLGQVSPNFHSLVNRPAGQPDGTALTDLLWEFVGLEDELEKIVTGDLPLFRLEYVQCVGSDGSTGYRNYQVMPLDEREPGRGLLLLVGDVSAAGHLQQQLVQERNELRPDRRELARLNEDLQRLNRLKSLFLSMAAHDLRTPPTFA